MRPSPADGTTVPAGDVELSLTNLTPNVGETVYVDVWFGTDPDALTLGLRRTTDMVRGVLERTRGDLTMAAQQETLRQELREFEERMSHTGAEEAGLHVT